VLIVPLPCQSALLPPGEGEKHIKRRGRERGGTGVLVSFLTRTSYTHCGERDGTKGEKNTRHADSPTPLEEERRVNSLPQM